jgi:hypothetical protein
MKTLISQTVVYFKTSTVVGNLVEEMISRLVGKKGTSSFIQKHQYQLESIYLRSVDSMRTETEYAPMTKQFYDLFSFVALHNGIHRLTLRD